MFPAHTLSTPRTSDIVYLEVYRALNDNVLYPLSKTTEPTKAFILGNVPFQGLKDLVFDKCWRSGLSTYEK